MGNYSIAGWDSKDDVAGSQRRHQHVRKDGAARIAQGNRSGPTLVGLQTLMKDVILPANAGGPGVSMADGNDDTPPLLLADEEWNGFQGGDPKDNQVAQGLISIIGAVLCLQAKTNSRIWSTLWKQASDSMMTQVKFAPIIGAAINAAYQAQSSATQVQADQAEAEGRIALISFAGVVGMSLFQEFKDPENPLNKTKDFLAKNETTSAANKVAEETEQNALKLTDKKVQTLEKTTDEAIAEKTLKGRAENTKHAVTETLGGRAKQRFINLLSKGVGMAQLTNMLSEGFTKYFVTSPALAQQAVYQQQEGGAHAVEKEAEQYAQFYGQNFSREEDLRGGSGQNIDYAMNILKSAADSITQTITSMFRG